MSNITVTVVIEEPSDEQLELLQRLGSGSEAVAVSAAPTPAKAAKKAAAPSKPVAVPDPEPEDEDLVGAGATLEDAVKRATELVADGKAAQVKAALATVGAKRVSELSGAKIQGFLDALDA